MSGYSDYDLARYMLLRPRMFFDEVQTLRDVLALIHGVAVGRYPPHGSGFLPGFCEFVRIRFKSPFNHYKTLLKQFGDLPWVEGSQAVLALLEEWQCSDCDHAFRQEHLTADEIARDEAIRRKVQAEFPPAPSVNVPGRLSQILKDAIRTSGKSINQIAQEAGVSETVVSRFLAGDRGIHMATADKLAEALGLKIASA